MVYKTLLEIIIQLLKGIKEALATAKNIVCTAVGTVNIKNDSILS